MRQKKSRTVNVTKGIRMARKNEDKIVYDEEIFKIGIKLYEIFDVPMDIVYHMLKNGKIKSFSAIILQSDVDDFETFLKKTKRKTDYLFPIDKEKRIFAMLCQETQVDGGFYFIKRLNNVMKSGEGGEEITAAIVGVESTHYSVRDLIFFMLDTYLKVLNDEENNISYRTIR